MTCVGLEVLDLTDCNGVLENIVDVEKHARSRVLCFGDGLFDLHGKICQRHLEQLSKGLQTICCNPFNDHGDKVKGIKVIGTKFRRIQSANPGLIKPLQSLCKNCFPKACQIPKNSDNSDTESQHSDSEINYFSDKNLSILNKILKNLGLSELHYERRNQSGKVALVKQAANDVKEAILKLFDIDVEKPKSDLTLVVEDLKFKLQDANRTEKIKVASLFSGTMSINKLSETFGISYKAASIASNLHRTLPILAEPPKKRMKGLNDDVVRAVKDFYENDEFSRVAPEMRNVKNIKNPDGTKNEVAGRILLCSITELFANFKKQYPEREYKIGRTKFGELRPSHCKLLKAGHPQVCLCIYHENLKLLYESVGIKQYKEFISKLVCDIESKNCMFRRCSDCRDDVKKQDFISNLSSYILEQHPKYEVMDITFEEWSHGSRDLKLKCSLNISHFLEYVFLQTSKFLRHQFTAHRQAKMFKEMKANVDKTTAIIQCDFAENYSPIYDREVQKAFFVKQSTTLHPFVVTLLHEDKPTTKSAVVISDEMHHITNTYYVFQKTILDWLKSEYPQIENVVYWSDGAGSQYKNFKNMANLRHHKDDFNLNASHHFFASCHGKGSCDAIGGVVKCKVRRAACSGLTIQSPEEFYKYVSENVKGVKSFYVSSDQIEEHVGKLRLEHRYRQTQKIPHIREIHKVVALAKTLEYYELSDDLLYSGKIYEEFNATEVEVGDWVAAFYDNDWYYGQIKSVLPDHEEFSVLFLEGKGDEITTFNKFETKPTYVPWCRVIMKVAAPNRPEGKRIFQFDTETKTKVMHQIELAY